MPISAPFRTFFHAVDLIRRKPGGWLGARAIPFPAGAVAGSIPPRQPSAWLAASRLWTGERA
jgi:hypothetical protein